jgi:cell division protein FtsW
LARLKFQLAKPDFYLLFTILGLTIFGLVMIFDASSVIAVSDFGDKFYYVKNQLIWFTLALVSLLFATFFNYHHYKKISIFALLLVVVLLILVLLPGFGGSVLGAKRRVDFGYFVLQPAEFLKIAFIIYLSSLFSRVEKGVDRRKFLIFLVLTVFILILLLLEPDLGTAGIVVLSALTILFLAGAPVWYFFLGAPFFLVGLFGIILTSSYRFDRLKTFLNPTNDTLGISYQINQVLIALGSGGLFGLGLGQSRQKYEFLPEVATDSIFAIIGEELGFLGGLVLISIFIFLAWRGFRIAKNAPDKFGFLLASGITSWIIFQAFLNLGSMVSILPLTGVPLPFISYGGSALISSFFGIGVLLNISRQAVLEKKPN